MKPLRTREDLIALVAQHAPSRACARAIREDRASVLGGFAPAKGLPFYVVRITARYGRVWHVAVDCDECNRRYVVRYVDHVPWSCWQGSRKGKRPLIDGDQPEVSAVERLRIRSKER